MLFKCVHNRCHLIICFLKLYTFVQAGVGEVGHKDGGLVHGVEVAGDARHRVGERADVPPVLAAPRQTIYRNEINR